MAARRYRVSIGDRTVTVEVRGETGAREVALDGVVHAAELQGRSGDGLRQLRVDERFWDVLLVLSEAGCSVAIDGVAMELRVEDERSARLARFGGGQARQTGLESVRAPMPGLVIRVNVEPGQGVKAGESLVVLQAMKMENELGSPRDGQIKQVSVQAGQAVEQGQVLVELE